MGLGATTAQAAGLNVLWARRCLIILSAVMTAFSTLLIGPLSFIGLLAPHLAHAIGARSSAHQLSAAALIGASVMMAADWLGRIWLFPYEIPAGLMASLLGGLYFGASWLDPLMGIVGAVLVSAWAWGLIRQTAQVLLDAEMDAPVVAEIREAVEQGEVPARIADLHVWQVGRGRFACVMEVEAGPGVEAETFRRALSVHEEIVHVTVEVRHAAGQGVPGVSAS